MRSSSPFGTRFHLVVGVLGAATLIANGCGGSRETNGEQAGSADAAAASPAQTQVAAPSGPIDAELAARGEGLFQAKACIGCHTIGKGRLTGPDLEGVTQRRDYGWIVGMVTNPDSMVRADPVAKSLFAEYMTPMVPVPVSPEEAAAIYEFLRREGER